MKRIFNARSLSLLTILILLLANRLYSHNNITRLSDDIGRVAHTHHVLDLTSEVMRVVVDAETGQRGFVLSGDEELLQPYKDAVARSNSLLASLRSETKDNPQQQQQITQLTSMIDARLARLQQGIAARNEKVQWADPLTAMRQGKEQMDGIRALVHEMSAEENRLLSERTRRSQSTYHAAVWANVITGTFSVCVILTFGWFVERSLAAGRRHAATIHRAHRVLQDEMHERGRVEQALRESERIYRAIGESIDYGVWLCDPEGKNTYASPSFLRLVGLTQEQCSGFGWAAALHPDDAERTIAEWENCVRAGGMWDMEFQFRGADDCSHPLLSRGVPVYDEHGKLQCWAGINLDISRMKITERELQLAHDELERRIVERTNELSRVNEELQREVHEHSIAESHLRERAEEIEALMDILPMPIWIAHDAHCYRISGNRAAYNLLRLPRGTNLSRTVPSGEEPADFRAVSQGLELSASELPIQRATSSGAAVHDAELDIILSDGSVRRVCADAVPLFDRAGKVRGGIASSIDVTERRALENDLRNSEERFRNAFDHAPTGMYMTGPDGRWLRVNQALCEIVGRNSAEMLATNFQAITHPDDVAAEATLLQKLHSGGLGEFQIEKRCLHADGHAVWVLLTASMVRDVQGAPLYVVGHFHDFTARKDAERKIRASLEEKEVLLKEVHHRVKNNLQVISSLLYLQSQQTHDQLSVEMFSESQQRVRSMALVHERLYRSPDLAQVDFAEYITCLADSLFGANRTNSDHIRLLVDVRDVKLPIDAAVPCGLLVNELISNCLKHAFPQREFGCIHVELQNVTGSELLLCVRDDGVGLPEHVHPETSPTFGMQVIVALVEQLHGSVQVDRIGGTEFRIRFPRAA